MASASATMGLYLAGSIAVPQYLGFDRLDPASLITITPDNIGSKIVVFIPAFVGAAGFVLPPHLKNVLGLLKLTRRASSSLSSSGASSAMQQAEQAGIEPSSAAASEPATSQLQVSPAAAALAQPEPAAATAVAPASAINMEETVSMIEDMVGKKVGEVVTDVTNMKNDVASFKGDITALKENIQNLTLSFESSLTDLKAFQAEMVNPLNFMRRYFETMDIKNLSDPMQPLPHIAEPAAAKTEQPAMVPAASVEGSETRQAQQQQQKLQDHNDGDNNNGNNNKKIDNLAARPPSPRRRQEGEEGEGDDDEGEHTEKQQLAQLQLSEAELRAAFRDLLPGIAPEMQPQQQQQQLPPVEDEPPMVVAAAGRPHEETTTAATAAASGNGNGNGHAGGQMFHGSLTLGKLMSMVSILEKLLRDIGPDELEVLIEQYRQFGLKAEDEAAVYNVVSMLKDFDMSPDEVMVQLYRLGQVMGIRDAQADLEYAKLQARIKSARRMQQQQQQVAAATAPTPAAATASRGDHLGHAYGRREQADG